LKNKDRLQLVKGLRSHSQGLYIEQQIERFLKIDDKPVEEEWRG
jgi:hypothetical protein